MNNNSPVKECKLRAIALSITDFVRRAFHAH